MQMRSNNIRSLRILAIPAFALLLALSIGATFQDHGYVGVDGCKMCHRSEAKGNQAGKWAESLHAKAFEVLGSDKSKEIAQDKGVGNPQEAEACLSCHVTGHGATDDKGPRFKVEDGVGCESCHGAGSAYNKMNIMRDHDAAVENGLLAITEATCTKCHNDKSPTFDGFNFEEMKAKIAHPNPQG